MNNIEDVKRSLSDIQKSFNPEKDTYKIIDRVIKENLSSKEMLMELTKIKGSNKYPEELKNKYKEVIVSLQDLILKEKALEEKRKQEENTKELRDIIDSLEKGKKAKEQLVFKADNDNLKEDVAASNADDSDNLVSDEDVKDDESLEKEEPLKSIFDLDKTTGKGLNRFLLIMIGVVILVIILVFLFY